MYASVPMLAYGLQSYSWNIIKIIILSVLTLYCGYFAALIWNDITDVKIDSIVHPERPIPSGRISVKKFFAIALFFSIMTFIFAMLVSTWCLFIVGATALFTAFHDKFLKNKVKIPAYSEIFTPFQWTTVALFGYFALWTSSQHSENLIYLPIFGYLSIDTNSIINMILLFFFIYFADNAHDLPEGILDIEGDKRTGVRTYATSFGEKNAARISFFMFFISGIIGIILYLRTVLSILFLVLFLILWLYILKVSYKLLKSDNKNRKKIAIIAGRRGFDYFLMSFNLIFVDLLIQLLYKNFNLF